MNRVKAAVTHADQFDPRPPLVMHTLRDALFINFYHWCNGHPDVRSFRPVVFTAEQLAGMPLATLGHDWDFRHLVGQTHGFRADHQAEDLPIIGQWIVGRLLQYKEHRRPFPREWTGNTLMIDAWRLLNVPMVGRSEGMGPPPTGHKDQTLDINPGTMFNEDQRIRPAYTVHLLDVMLDQDPQAILQGLPVLDDPAVNARRLMGDVTPESSNALVNTFSQWLTRMNWGYAAERDAVHRVVQLALPLVLAAVEPLHGHPVVTEILNGWSQRLGGGTTLSDRTWGSMINTALNHSRDASFPPGCPTNADGTLRPQDDARYQQGVQSLIERATAVSDQHRTEVRVNAQREADLRVVTETRHQEQARLDRQAAAWEHEQAHRTATIDAANQPLTTGASPVRRMTPDDLEVWKNRETARHEGRVPASSRWGHRQAFNDMGNPDMMEDFMDHLPQEAAESLVGHTIRHRRP